MHALTSEGSDRLDRIARDHRVSTDAARTLLDALLRGGGAQAQFSHPDLGGMGQWSSGGMIMIGDMFNTDLKARVGRLCADLSGLLRDPASFEASPDADVSLEAERPWWPPGLGRSTSSGSQNGSRYAYFPLERRLAVEEDGNVRVYDTADHHITGVSQSQGDDRDLAFHSQKGTVRVHELARIGAAAEARQADIPSDTERPSAARGQATNVDETVATIAKLHDLMQRGVLTDAEFLDKKKDLLGRV